MIIMLGVVVLLVLGTVLLALWLVPVGQPESVDSAMARLPDEPLEMPDWPPPDW